jgi:hypothetical protein
MSFGTNQPTKHLPANRSFSTGFRPVSYAAGTVGYYSEVKTAEA